ncbi:hypothetical protein C6361_21560 [Plantactinospora sp. BC1]|uniref:hypothetical protein n=1 Tax=Plantactinospora sp. BC1 TaxID=2108470 RepID=UPI000D16B81E|nr:hypothetical protein [Plantactinospora sp. BC1]AVT31636.1 hypothetical protein C6361_21560 [Plantactinospora sp. BC1]
MTYSGSIIRESLERLDVLAEVSVTNTVVEEVTEAHRTPWLTVWTRHDIEVDDERVDEVAQRISEAIDPAHPGSWYVDFRSPDAHYVIFRHRVFRVDPSTSGYEQVKEYGARLGIPASQLDFA